MWLIVCLFLFDLLVGVLELLFGIWLLWVVVIYLCLGCLRFVFCFLVGLSLVWCLVELLFGSLVVSYLVCCCVVLCVWFGWLFVIACFLLILRCLLFVVFCI